MVEAKMVATRRQLHVDPLKKLPTSNMGIYSHHSKSIVAGTSNRGVGGGVDFGVRHRVGTHLGGQLEI